MLAPLALLACTATPAGPAVSLTSAAPDRPTVSLDGDWEFILDPQREGWAAGWSSGRHALPHTCEVPGAWEAQGFGNATDRLWHSYTVGNQTLDQLFPTGGYNTPLGGLAWYRKTVQLHGSPGFQAGGGGPEQRLFLRVGGVHRSVTAYANGERLGQHTGYLHELEWDVTKATAGKSSLAVVLAVDSFHNNTVSAAAPLRFLPQPHKESGCADRPADGLLRHGRGAGAQQPCWRRRLQPAARRPLRPVGRSLGARHARDPRADMAERHLRPRHERHRRRQRHALRPKQRRRLGAAGGRGLRHGRDSGQ